MYYANAERMEQFPFTFSFHGSSGSLFWAVDMLAYQVPTKVIALQARGKLQLHKGSAPGLLTLAKVSKCRSSGPIHQQYDYPIASEETLRYYDGQSEV